MDEANRPPVTTVKVPVEGGPTLVLVIDRNQDDESTSVYAVLNSGEVVEYMTIADDDILRGRTKPICWVQDEDGVWPVVSLTFTLFNTAKVDLADGRSLVTDRNNLLAPDNLDQRFDWRAWLREGTG